MKASNLVKLVVMFVLIGSIAQGALEVNGLVVGKPPLLNPPAFGWVAVDADAWPAVNAVAKQYGELVGFSSETQVEGTGKKVICRAIYSFRQGKSGCQDAAAALKAKSLPVLNLLNRATVSLCWERFLRYVYAQPASVNVMRVGVKRAFFDLGDDDRARAKSLNVLSEACQNPLAYTKKYFETDCKYFWLERPNPPVQWMDILSMRIETNDLGNPKQIVFQIKLFMNGSGKKPFDLPAKDQDCWRN